MAATTSQDEMEIEESRKMKELESEKIELDSEIKRSEKKIEELEKKIEELEKIGI